MKISNLHFPRFPEDFIFSNFPPPTLASNYTSLHSQPRINREFIDIVIDYAKCNRESIMIYRVAAKSRIKIPAKFRCHYFLDSSFPRFNSNFNMQLGDKFSCRNIAMKNADNTGAKTWRIRCSTFRARFSRAFSLRELMVGLVEEN